MAGGQTDDISRPCTVIAPPNPTEPRLQLYEPTFPSIRAPALS